MAEENLQKPQDNIVPKPQQNVSAKDRLMQGDTPPPLTPAPVSTPEPEPIPKSTPTPEITPTPTPEPKNKVQGKPKVDLGHTTKLKDWPPKDAPASPNKEESQNEKEEVPLRTIRTYKDDLAQVVGKKKESLVSIATAENERRVKNGEPLDSIEDEVSKKQRLKKIGIIILSATLFVLGAGSVFYFYGKSGTETVKPDSSIPSVIFSDEEEEFEITDLSRRQILNGLTTLKDHSRLSIGRTKNVFITQSFVDEEGIETRELVGASDFLNAINAQLPTSFLRSLEPLFMFGVYHFDGNRPFLILKNSFYENTFAGMLSWERDIKEDLAPLFGPAEFDVVSGNDSETNTPSIIVPTFSDFVIKNKDARILKDNSGEIVLMYSFIDKNTIVITTNENTFSEVFTRMTSSRTLR
ncbi:MAG TPA: hypothetical protein QF620_01075 [Candidatus Paceibacterota bacterium]|jgi:hypothetical protein|nr:hypothetical protein [Candidatus Paceibacterota bacterium]MDP7367922.1 hypothetical protein [Candidatus Paceibacterota bacterium]HJO89752.1 hypothetical protein [Candidatus Paceibacterota bacterium]